MQRLWIVVVLTVSNLAAAGQGGASLIREYFDKPSDVVVVKSPSCTNISSRIVNDGVFGDGSLAVTWSGKDCLAIVRKKFAPCDFSGKMFRLHYKVLAGKWELPTPVKIGFNFGRDNMYVVGEDKIHGFIAMTLYDADGKMVESHLWRSWWWHSKPGKWTWIYLTTGNKADRGGVYTYQKGKGDIHRVARIDFCASQAPGVSGKAGILWDGLDEMNNRLEYITPNIQQLLAERKSWREDENWNRKIIKTKALVRSVLTKSGNVEFLEDSSDDGVSRIPARIIVRDASANNKAIAPKQIWESGKYGLGCRLELQGKSKEQDLEIEFVVKPKLKGRLWYFDGIYPHYSPSKRVEKRLFGMRKNRDMLPFISLHNSRRQIMVGLDPQTMVSYIHTIFDPESQTMKFIIRVVVPKEANRTVRFLAAVSPAVYGFREALQWYYDSSPEAFKPEKGLDSRMYLAAADDIGYLHYKGLRWQGPYDDYYMETSRRFSAGWSWIFAGWPYAIEWSGKSKWMSQYEIRFGSRGRLLDYQREDLAMPDWRAGIVPCFYMSNFMEVAWKKRFRDSSITEGLCLNGSGCFGGWNFQRVYMGDNCSYAKFYNPRLYQLLRYCQFGGISMDAFGGLGGWKYRGPEVSKIVGAAFDKKGVFVDEGVGLHEFYEALKKAGKPREGGRYAITSTAGSDTYHGAMSIDVGLAEICVFRPQYDGLYAMRQMMGRKPISLYGSHVADDLGRKLNWKSMTKGQVSQLYRDLFDYTILAAVTFATPIDTDDLWGDAKGQRYQRPIVKLARLGYQPATGVRCDNPELWIRRYGRGVNSIITFADFSNKSPHIECRIDNDYIGKGRWVPMSYWSEVNMNSVIEPADTLFDMNLKKRTPELVRLGWAVENVDDNATIQAMTHWSETETGRESILNLLGPWDKPLTVRAYLPAEHTVESIKSANANLSFKVCADYVQFTLPPAKQTKITIVCKSTLFKSPKSQLLNYAYVSRSGRGAAVVIPNISEYFIDKRIARRIVAFFRFWYEEATPKAMCIEMPIVNKEMFHRVYKRGRMIKIVKGEMCVRFEKSSAGGNIVISGQTPQEREHAALALLKLLETKYPFVGVMPSGRLKENSPTATYRMREAMGLLGKPVPIGLK